MATRLNITPMYVECKTVYCTSNTKLPSKLSLSQIGDNREGDIQLPLQITTGKCMSPP